MSAEAQTELDLAFDSIAIGMLVLDAEGRVRRANARALRLLRSDGAERAEDLSGRRLIEVVLQQPGAADGLIGDALHSSRTVRGTLRAPTRGRVFEIVASPLPGGGLAVALEDQTFHHALADRYRVVVETASDAIVITDLDRVVAFANPAACELFGTSELVGQSVEELTPPEWRDEVARREHEALGGRPQRYETAILRPDGALRTVEVSTAPLREVGEITGVIASLRDVTEEQAARQAVAASEARYRELFEGAMDAIYTLDSRGAFTSANRATCEISGYSREELMGQPMAPLLDPAEWETVLEHFRAAKQGVPRRYECHFFHKSGGRRLAQVTNTPIIVRGEVVGVLGIARDITAERERDQALARSEASYLRLVESASDAIFTVDADGRLTSLNHALERALGRSRRELLGTMAEEMVESSDQGLARRIFEATMRGERQRAEIRFRGAMGERRVGSVTTTPIIEEGTVTGGLGVVRDVTEERALAEQLYQREKLAAVGQLVSGVAHELNNPLAGIMAFSQLLLGGQPLTSEQQDAVTTINSEARRAARIISNLLLFARQRKPERTSTDLNQVLRDTLELRRYVLRTHQIEVETHFDPRLPTTWADPFQLQQVFLNLITNAEHALRDHQGSKRITLHTRRRGGWLVASVIDNGPGMEPEVVDHIFNPFYTTKPVGEGTGLGLSISDGIVREHGGHILVESRPGRGSVFEVELPVLEVPDDVGRPSSAGPSAAPRAARSILVVDDEQSIRTALAIYLRRSGHAVDVVGSGTEALERARGRRYDAILLDMRMPDMSGGEVYARLRDLDPELAERVVFTTGDMESEGVRTLLRDAGRPYLAKPFELEEAAATLLKEARAT